MRRIFWPLLFCFAATAINSRASIEQMETRFIPEQFMINAPPSLGPSNMTEDEFKAIIAKIQSTYAPIVTGHGGTLSISGEWKNEKLNAGAAQRGKSWQVMITGGLARRTELTKDGFALIVCHELGHHLGGFPIASRGPMDGTWAANEGQSDYFATQVCTRRIWKEDLAQNETFREQATPEKIQLCERAWLKYDDQNLCLRVLSATESMILTMATLMQKPVPQFSTPDQTQVTKTNDNHPPVQCRMDTSLMGAICLADFTDQLIPGKKTKSGHTSLEAEQEAAQFSCTRFSGFVDGYRPACWFKSRL